MILVIDIGGSGVKYAYAKDNVLISKVQKFEIGSLEELKVNIKSLVKSTTKGIAISSPGAVNRKTKIIHGISALAFIHENDWVNELEKELSIPISIENDANSAILAEHWLGNAQDYDNVVSFIIGTGIGGGVIIDGQLHCGKDLHAGEFGFMLINYQGKMQCVSKVCSTNALVERIKPICEVENGLDVFELIKSNDEVMIEFKNYCQDIAMVLYNINHSINPDLILIGGAISQQSLLIDQVKIAYCQLLEKVGMSTVNPPIVACQFNNDANLLGALKNWYNEQQK